MKTLLTCLTLLVSMPYTYAQNWIDHIRDFREAIYQRDKEKARQYFDFPITTTASTFFRSGASYCPRPATQKQLLKLSDSDKPVTESLFDLYFDDFFNKKFITALLKLKTQELYDKGETTTQELTNDQVNFYRMNAQYDPKEQTVLITIIERTTEKSMDPINDFVYAFLFTVRNGQFKFVRVTTAG